MAEDKKRRGENIGEIEEKKNFKSDNWVDNVLGERSGA